MTLLLMTGVTLYCHSAGILGGVGNGIGYPGGAKILSEIVRFSGANDVTVNDWCYRFVLD